LPEHNHVSITIEKVAHSLFEELGGMNGMKVIVHNVMELVMQDPNLAHHFHYTDMEIHNKRLAHYFAHITGGSEEWIGKPLNEVHCGMFIDQALFKQFFECIRSALTNKDVLTEDLHADVH
jgi:hemoglobin